MTDEGIKLQIPACPKCGYQAEPRWTEHGVMAVSGESVGIMYARCVRCEYRWPVDTLDSPPRVSGAQS